MKVVLKTQVGNSIFKYETPINQEDNQDITDSLSDVELQKQFIVDKSNEIMNNLYESDKSESSDNQENKNNEVIPEIESDKLIKTNI